MDYSLNQSTYYNLKNDILMFNLKPGETVSAAKVAERYNVSRTPARETLVKLETEGLVDIIPQSKTIISRIDIDKAKQEWFIRRTLELGMVDVLVEKVTDEDIERMEHYNGLMQKYSKNAGNNEDRYLYLLADNDFHDVTYRTAGEEMALGVIRNCMAHYSRIRFLSEQEDFYTDRTVSGHDELIKLLKKRDRDGYRDALSTHLDYIVKDMEKLKKTYPDYFDGGQ